jgi:hypothetical protein
MMVMLGFDAEERLLQKANVPEPLIARMMGGNAARQFAVKPFHEGGRIDPALLSTAARPSTRRMNWTLWPNCPSQRLVSHD